MSMPKIITYGVALASGIIIVIAYSIIVGFTSKTKLEEKITQTYHASKIIMEAKAISGTYIICDKNNNLIVLYTSRILWPTVYEKQLLHQVWLKYANQCKP